MRVSEICVKRIRVNQGLGVHKTYYNRVKKVVVIPLKKNMWLCKAAA